jgi:plastocyanin
LSAAIVLAGAGCGDEGDTVRVNGGVLRLTVDEYRIVPARVSVPPGNLKILIRDVGRLTHNVRVEDHSQRDPGGAPLQLGGTDTAHPGQRASGTLVLAPGKYRMVCTIANHELLGQYGTLIVEAQGGGG